LIRSLNGVWPEAGSGLLGYRFWGQAFTLDVMKMALGRASDPNDLGGTSARCAPGSDRGRCCTWRVNLKTQRNQNSDRSNERHADLIESRLLSPPSNELHFPAPLHRN
jgi:hypothetical protein